MGRNKVLVLPVLALLHACSTTSDLSDARGEGTTRVYAASFREAVARSEWVLATFFPEVESDGSGHLTATSVGEVTGPWSSAAVWVESLGESRCRVTVVTKRYLSVQVPTRMTEARFHEMLGLTPGR